MGGLGVTTCPLEHGAGAVVVQDIVGGFLLELGRGLGGDMGKIGLNKRAVVLSGFCHTLLTFEYRGVVVTR